MRPQYLSSRATAVPLPKTSLTPKSDYLQGVAAPDASNRLAMAFADCQQIILRRNHLLVKGLQVNITLRPEHQNLTICAMRPIAQIRPHRWGREVFEAPGVEPVFQAKAMDVLQSFTASQLLPLGAPIRQGSRESQVRRQY